MSEKEPTSINLRTDHREWLERHGYNRSQFINNLLDDVRNGEQGVGYAAQEFEKRRLENKEEHYRKQLETVQEQKEAVEKDIVTEEEQHKETWREAVENIEPPADIEQLKGVTAEEWTPREDADIVHYYANELEISPAEFCEQYPDKRGELL